MQKPLVSIIVPVYNTEAYLKRCLESLRLQTLECIEIIIVDDGSTDLSNSICDSYADLDSRFIVLHKKHEGLSAARNDGIDRAQANYIMLVDSDDWVEPDFCETPFRVAKKTGADIVAFRNYRHKKYFSKKTKRFHREGIVNSEELLTKYWLHTGETPWNKMYHRKLFSFLRYPIGRLCEDSAITYKLVYEADKIAVINNCIYHYQNIRPGSISFNRTTLLMQDYYSFEFERIEYLQKWGYCFRDERLRIALSYRSVMGKNKELSEQCDSIILSYKGIIRAKLCLRHKLMYCVYRISPKVFDYISVITKKRIQ